MYEHETLQDELDRRDGIPDYYDTMSKREQQELERSIKAELEKTVEKALDELLAGFNK